MRYKLILSSPVLLKTKYLNSQSDLIPLSFCHPLLIKALGYDILMAEDFWQLAEGQAYP